VWLDDLEISNPVLFNQIHIFSTFFYKKLSSGQRYVTSYTIAHLHSLLPSLQKGYDDVCTWAKCDIFLKKYLIVPINEDYHWYFVIFYEPEHVLNGDERDIDNTPK